jgi:hypothetical protein
VAKLSRVPAHLKLTRGQILAFRRRTNALDARLPPGEESLRRAAWAGLQDSMPRAALLSLHARVEGIGPDALDDPALAQLWGPRYSTYVVPKRDFALFSLGRLPDGKARARAEEMAALMHEGLGGKRLTDRELGPKIGVGNAMRYAAPTGTIAIRWEGARAPLVWTVPAPDVDPAEAQRELARRYLHVFGPTTAASFAKWAGVGKAQAARTFAALELELLPADDGWLLAEDEPLLHEDSQPAQVRLLPSGDAYWLLDGAERELLVPDAQRRAQLWTPRVWPGALLVDGEIRGTWRRAQHLLTVDLWEPVPREAVEAEARTLPLPGLDRELDVVWGGG